MVTIRRDKIPFDAPPLIGEREGVTGSALNKLTRAVDSWAKRLGESFVNRAGDTVTGDLEVEGALTVEGLSVLTDVAWTTVTPSTGWTTPAGFFGVRYRRVGKSVEVEISVRSSGATAAFATIAVMPSLTPTVRPASNVGTGCFANSAGSTVVVLTNGAIQLPPAYGVVVDVLALVKYSVV